MQPAFKDERTKIKKRAATARVPISEAQLDKNSVLLVPSDYGDTSSMRTAKKKKNLNFKIAKRFRNKSSTSKKDEEDDQGYLLFELSREISLLNEKESKLRECTIELANLPGASSFSDKTREIEKRSNSMITLTSKTLTCWSKRIIDLQKSLEEEKRRSEHLEKLTKSFSKNRGNNQQIDQNSIILADHFWKQTTKRTSLLRPRSSCASSIDQSFYDAVGFVDQELPIATTEIVQEEEEEKKPETNRQIKVRRKQINPRPDIRLNLWSFIKNAIGKDLTKIPFPVHFNEPLSALQRVTEDLMYSALIDKAAESADRGDPIMQLAYFAAFTVSVYSKSLDRTTKPFNPLLGETYEFDRVAEPEWGWRSISEQVSHHPPIVAFHAESLKSGWQFHQEFLFSVKFRGKYLVAQPKGCLRMDFRDGSVITWNRATTCLNNIVIGKLWIDHYGTIKIMNHTNGYSCELNLVPYSRFSNENHIVKGVIKDANGKAQYYLSGFWDNYLEGFHSPNDNSERKLLWKALPPREDAADVYFLSNFAVEMNEPEDGVAPTDTRLRPDQRLFEDGSWDEANEIKAKLESKQRSKRKESFLELHRPKWFHPVQDSYHDDYFFQTNKKYWKAKEKQDWSACPKIFSYE